jgi:hypothetical protein
MMIVTSLVGKSGRLMYYQSAHINTSMATETPYNNLFP